MTFVCLHSNNFHCWKGTLEITVKTTITKQNNNNNKIMVICTASFSAVPQTTCVPWLISPDPLPGVPSSSLAYKLGTVKTVLLCTDWSLREMLYFYKRALFIREVMLKILPLPSLMLLDAFSRHYKHLSYFIQRYKTLEFLFSLESHSYYLTFGCVCLSECGWTYNTMCRWRSEDNFVGVSYLLWVLGIRLSLSCFRGKCIYPLSQLPCHPHIELHLNIIAFNLIIT